MQSVVCKVCKIINTLKEGDPGSEAGKTSKRKRSSRIVAPYDMTKIPLQRRIKKFLLVGIQMLAIGGSQDNLVYRFGI